MNTAAVKEKYAAFITTSERTLPVAMVNLLTSRHQEDVQLAKRSSAHLEHLAALRSLAAASAALIVPPGNRLEQKNAGVAVCCFIDHP